MLPHVCCSIFVAANMLSSADHTLDCFARVPNLLLNQPLCYLTGLVKLVLQTIALSAGEGACLWAVLTQLSQTAALLL